MKELFTEKAVENIRAAELLFENELYNASANRAYYAAFHSAIAAIYHAGFIPVIDHKSVRTLFSDCFFNKRKILSSKYNRYLSDLQDKRNHADYRMGVSKTIAKKQLREAKEFLEIILGIIK